MYSKIIGFLQGSDNQVVIKAANYHGIKIVIMPFASSKFIYNVVQYKNNFLEVIKPKYFVRSLLKKNRIRWKMKSKKNNNLAPENVIDKYESAMNKLFEEKIQLFLKTESNKI